MQKTERTRRLEFVKQQLEIAVPPIDADNFVVCAVCGQFYDVRDFKRWTGKSPRAMRARKNKNDAPGSA